MGMKQRSRAQVRAGVRSRGAGERRACRHRIGRACGRNHPQRQEQVESDGGRKSRDRGGRDRADRAAADPRGVRCLRRRPHRSRRFVRARLSSAPAGWPEPPGRHRDHEAIRDGDGSRGRSARGGDGSGDRGAAEALARRTRRATDEPVESPEKLRLVQPSLRLGRKVIRRDAATPINRSSRSVKRTRTAKSARC